MKKIQPENSSSGYKNKWQGSETWASMSLLSKPEKIKFLNAHCSEMIILINIQIYWNSQWKKAQILLIPFHPTHIYFL